VRIPQWCSLRNSGMPQTMRQLHPPHFSGDWEHSGEIPMKTILSALVALSVIAGVAGGAVAMDAKEFYERVDRNHF
jgi:hypothetical protein